MALEGWEHDPLRARRQTQALAERQAQEVGQLKKLLTEADRRRTALREVRSEEERLVAEGQQAAELLAAAEHEADERAAELADAYLTYLSGLTELLVADPDDVVEGLRAWAAIGDGTNPAVAAINDAAMSAQAQLGRLSAGLAARQAEHSTRAGELEAEIERLRAGGHDAPPRPRTTESCVRDDRPGAPLWKVTDFVPHVPPEHRAGLEAALDAAGILDAWVTPDGKLVAGDVTVVSGLAPVPGPSCASVLTPAVDDRDPQARLLSRETVRGVLAAIGLGDGTGTGTTWVMPDGRWANGVLGGAWHKDSAEHIGEGARESARRAAIERLSGELSQQRNAIADVDEALAGLRVREERLAAEHRTVPPDTDVRDARTIAAARSCGRSGQGRWPGTGIQQA